MWAVSPDRPVGPPFLGISLCPTHPLALLLGNLVCIKPLFDVSLAREFTVLFGFTQTWVGILVLPLSRCEPLGRRFNLAKPKSSQPHNGDVVRSCEVVHL